MSMKRIDVVELYVKKRVEKLEQSQNEYKLNAAEITELKDVLDVIEKTKRSNGVKKTQIEIGEPTYNKNLTIKTLPIKG